MPQEKFKVRREEKNLDDTFVFKVFIPNTEEGRQLKNKIISYAKLYTDNEVWLTLKIAMEYLIKSEENMKGTFLDRLNKLEEEIYEEKKKEDKVPTFGGSKG